MGAVMGSKNLKAIVIEGTGKYRLQTQMGCESWQLMVTEKSLLNRSIIFGNDKEQCQL